MRGLAETVENPLDDEQRTLVRRHLAEIIDELESAVETQRAGESKSVVRRPPRPARRVGASVDDLRRGIGELEQDRIAGASLRAINKLLEPRISGSEPLASCARVIKAAVERPSGGGQGLGGDSTALKERGWVIREFSYRPSPLDRPPVSYTLGLSDRWDHPELACIAIEHSIAVGILGELAGHVTAGQTIRGDEGQLSNQLGFEVRATTASPELVSAIVGLTGSAAQPAALQIVVKDEHGRVPGEHLQSLRASAQTAIRSAALRRGLFGARGWRARRG